MLRSPRLRDVRIEDRQTGVSADLDLQSKRTPRGTAQAWSFPVAGPNAVHRAVDLDAGKLRSVQTFHSFGAGEVIVDGTDLGEASLDAHAGLLQSSQAVAQRLLQSRLQDRTFEQAVRAEFPHGPLELVARDRAQLPFTQDGSFRNYATFSASAPDGFGFTLGIPIETESTNYVASRGNVRNLVISVTLQGREATEVKAAASSAAPADDPRKGLEQANRQGRWEDALRRLEELRVADVAQWRAAEAELRVAGALAHRTGRSSPELERQEFLLALDRATDRTPLATPVELAELAAHAAIYAPADFRLTGELPPTTYPTSVASGRSGS